MIKFIHTADFHFGVENYGKIDPKTGIHSRLLDFQNALNFCIDRALEEDVDFFLFAGDAYKTTHPTPTQQKLLLNSFLRLYKAGIPIIIIVGNHDNPISFGKVHSLDVFSNLPLDGFHVISKPKIITLDTKNGPMQIVGIPWPTKNNLLVSNKKLFCSSSDIVSYISKSIGTIIESFAQKLDPVIPSLLAAHLTVSTGIFSGSEKRAIYGQDPLFLPSQLAISPFDYIALGHLHRYQNLNKNGYPAVVYSGSIERVDFGERNEEKGFCLVTIEEKGKASHEFIQIPTRPFIQVEVTLNTILGQTTQIIEALKKHNLQDSVVKIIYHIPEGKKDTVNLQLLQKAIPETTHIAGIIPVRKATTRERRSYLKLDMDFEALLGAYLDTKETDKEKNKKLIEKAMLLYQETRNNEQEL